MKLLGRIVVWLLSAVLITVGMLVLLEIPVPLLTKTDTGQAEETTGSAMASSGPSGEALEVQEVSSREPVAGSIKAVRAEKKETGKKENENEDPNENEDQKEEEAEEAPKAKITKAEESYFEDALFIGDSRTVGMQESELLPQATYYAKVGIGIGPILEERIVNENGTMISISEALQRHSFAKVYIMIGINDMSSGDVDWFLERYQEILDVIQTTQPEALIFIQGNIPMSYGKQESGSSEGALTNANLKKRNEASRTLADGERIFYLDTQDIYSDSYGNLASSYTTDGLHVKTKYYTMWVDYLLNHAVVFE